MPYVYLISAVALMSVLSLLGTGFNKKNEGEKNTTPFYNFLVCSSACLTWGVIYAFDFSFEPKALLYSLGFGVCYAGIMISLIKALAVGPTSLTALMQQLSLIGTTVWGFAFWGTWNIQKAPLVVSGLVLVVISLCLSLYSGKKSEEKISLKWLGYAAIVFLANAGCAIFQKQQQIDFNGEHGSMFMFFAVLLSALICFAVFAVSEKPDVKKIVKTSWVYPLGAGMSSALGNMFIVILATSTLSPNLIYPAIAVGGLAITSVASVYFFKEKLKWWQWIGVAVGALAVALLSIS
ncbi:MAG: EamA family transporter [Clostridia bacterium]|nr:EamA family transporter [Clostridia bacterium]